MRYPEGRLKYVQLSLSLMPVAKFVHFSLEGGDSMGNDGIKGIVAGLSIATLVAGASFAAPAQAAKTG